MDQLLIMLARYVRILRDLAEIVRVLGKEGVLDAEFYASARARTRGPIFKYLTRSRILAAVPGRDLRLVAPCTAATASTTIPSAFGSTSTVPCDRPCAGRAGRGTAGQVASIRHPAPGQLWRLPLPAVPAEPDAEPRTRCSLVLVLCRPGLQPVFPGHESASSTHSLPYAAASARRKGAASSALT